MTFSLLKEIKLTNFLQALYVCYFREVQGGEQLFQHLHKRNANVDVRMVSEEKWFKSLEENLLVNEKV